MSSSMPLSPGHQASIRQVLSMPSAGSISFSVEFMPSRDDAAEERLLRTAEAFYDLGASFAPATYGAGGSSHDCTLRITQRVSKQPLAALVYLTLVEHTVDELRGILRSYLSTGLTNLLVLRGDPPGDPFGPWVETEGDLHYTSELTELTKAEPEFGKSEVGIASFPKGHYHSPDLNHGTQYTLVRLCVGAEYSITQMFFNTEHYLCPQDRLVEADPVHGVRPIIPGLMPITSLRSVCRQIELFGAQLLSDLEERLIKTVDGDEQANKDETRKIGIEFSTNIAEHLIAEGVPGLHFMTMNFARASQEVLHDLGTAPTWGTGQDMLRGGF